MTVQWRTIVVGVDDSPESRAAVRWGAELARVTGAQLLLAAAWQLPVSFGAPYGDAEREAEEIVAKASAEADLPADRVRTTVQEGMPGKTLVGLAEGADLLVVGSRGHGAIAGAMISSVSAYCVRHARCPVTVAR